MYFSHKNCSSKATLVVPKYYLYYYYYLTVRLGNALNFILLLDGVRVTASSCGIDQLLGQTLGHSLEVPKARLPRPCGKEVQGVVHPTEGGHVHSLSANDTRPADTGGILARSTVDNGINDHLHRILIRQEVNNLEGVLDDPYGHELLPAVTALAHEAARQALHDGTGRLAEAFLLVSAGGVGEVRRVISLDGDVVDEGNVADFDIIERPFAKEFNFGGAADGDKLLLLFLDVGDFFDGFFYVRHGDGGLRVLLLLQNCRSGAVLFWVLVFGV